jgi:hypothetical protein
MSYPRINLQKLKEDMKNVGRVFCPSWTFRIATTTVFGSSAVFLSSFNYGAVEMPYSYHTVEEEEHQLQEMKVMDAVSRGCL